LRLSQFKSEVLAAIDRAAKGATLGDLRFEVEQIEYVKKRKPKMRPRRRKA